MTVGACLKRKIRPINSAISANGEISLNKVVASSGTISIEVGVICCRCHKYNFFPNNASPIAKFLFYYSSKKHLKGSFTENRACNKSISEYQNLLKIIKSKHFKNHLLYTILSVCLLFDYHKQFFVRFSVSLF